MNFRKCKCGGTMVKQTRFHLKTSNDVKVRMRCTTCKSFAYVYEKPNGTFDINPRKNGRPFDVMVMA